MDKFTIAAAQSRSIKGDFQRNMGEHVMFAKTAAENRVDVIVFPELSLTGYEPELAQELALSINDKVLDPLVDASNEWDIAIIAGCPVRSISSRPYLGAFIIQPGKPVSVYRKRYLHTGEERHFIPSQDNAVFNYREKQIGIAICADIDNPQHPADAERKGANIYAAGVCITHGGIHETSETMSRYASQHNMITVMANHAVNTGGYTTEGRSAIWSNSGKLLAMADGTGRYLVSASEKDNEWIGKTIKI